MTTIGSLEPAGSVEKPRCGEAIGPVVKGQITCDLEEGHPGFHESTLWGIEWCCSRLGNHYRPRAKSLSLEQAEAAIASLRSLGVGTFWLRGMLQATKFDTAATEAEDAPPACQVATLTAAVYLHPNTLPPGDFAVEVRGFDSGPIDSVRVEKLSLYEARKTLLGAYGLRRVFRRLLQFGVLQGFRESLGRRIR